MSLTVQYLDYNTKKSGEVFLESVTNAGCAGRDFISYTYLHRVIQNNDYKKSLK